MGSEDAFEPAVERLEVRGVDASGNRFRQRSELPSHLPLEGLPLPGQALLEALLESLFQALSSEFFGNGHDGFLRCGGQLGDSCSERVEGEILGDVRNIHEELLQRIPTALRVGHVGQGVRPLVEGQ
jgi:hypothetical protein